MNKSELVNEISSKTNVTKKRAADILTATTDTIVETVAGGDKVTLMGFGSFESRDRAARVGRNPETGERLKIKATTVPAFSQCKAFKDTVKK